MHHPCLDTFVAVAELGSFSKAAEKRYISTTAVVKQMNQMEAETGVTLFDRGRRGVRLTEAGESLYEDARLIIRLSEDAIRRARQLGRHDLDIVRIGTSVLRSAMHLYPLWAKLNAGCPDLRIYIVPFEDSRENYLETIRNLGRDIDVIAGIYPAGLWNNACRVLKLTDIPICCAMSRRHPLAQKERLAIRDLYGQRVMIVERGTAEHIDAVRDELLKHPQIRIADTHFYDLDVFNECETTGSIMITAESWTDVHPSLVTIPVDWGFTVPYGLICAKEPTSAVKRFLEAVLALSDKGTDASGIC